MAQEDEKSGVLDSLLPPTCRLTVLCLREMHLPKQHDLQAWRRRAGEPRWPGARSTPHPQRLTSVMHRRDHAGLPPPTADNGVGHSLWGAFLGSPDVE